MRICADCGIVTSKTKRNLCLPCYRDWYNNVRPSAPRCLQKDCSRPQYSTKVDYCHLHKRRLDRGASSPEGVGRGRPGVARGKKSNLGYYITSGGYRKIRLDGVVGDSAWVLEHRHAMEQKLGRKLLSGENVHHIDGNKLNNNISNLELWASFQPSGQRVEDLLKYAYEIIERYGK